MAGDRPWATVTGGVTVAVRLTPKGGRDVIDGIERMADGRNVIKARVNAAPSEGEANNALIRLIAKTVGVPLRDVTITAGAAARSKRLTISGDGPTLIAALEKICLPR
jgi:uncharacterized protein (TIGR00251 family)